MSSLNKHSIMGYVVRDPEIKETANGKKFAKFSVVTNRTYKTQDGEKKEIPTFHNVACFGSLAELVEKYVTKGKLLYVEGPNEKSTYEVDGVKKEYSQLMAEKVVFCGNNGGNQNQDPKKESSVTLDDWGDDIPF